MSGLSDRDQKLILVLLTIMVILLPYFFYIKDKKVEIETIKTENVALNERLEYLRELDTHREEYIKETEQMNKDRDVIIASFPADVKQENYTMFLLNTEYSSPVITDPITGLEVLENPIVFSAVTYGDNVESPISSDEADTGFSAITNSSSITYNCYYGGLKYMLEYLMSYEDPMAYRTISMDFDPASGVIEGAITLEQYAISGGDRKLADVIIKPEVKEGNEEVGVFGPVEKTEEEEEAIVVEEVEADAEAEAE